ncbi:hypothetical protein BSZ36_15485 [Rubricoccus marinus]|uniref:Bacterial surface antigen (D15) domain-containing protein n=1 Tax=Rubricoccus marinus TaxID=716817 RepID=A0A259U2Q6_9BACT|nr:hypothetical protein BSZ36_15485 [Rubricoccus marinus]
MLAALALLAGCATSGRYVDGEATMPLPAADLAYEVFLLGNTADVVPGADVLGALRADALRAGENSAVVFLGDLTASGLPSGGVDSASFVAPEAIQRLVDVVDGYDGEVYAVPGDRDWATGAGGVIALGEALDLAMGREDVLLPGDALGGVREFELAEGLRLFAIDTAWWLQNPEDRPEGEVEDFDIASPADLTIALEALLRDREDAQIIAVGHHPIRSNGEHAGYRTVGGTLAGLGVGPLLRQTIGISGQDLASPTYRSMRSALDRAFAGDAKLTNGLVYAAAHDHSLQVIPVERSPLSTQMYLVSGAAGETRPTASGRGAAYAHPAPGYMRIRYYEDGRTWLEVIELASGGPTVAYRTEISGVNAELLDNEVPDVDPADLPDTSQPVTMAAQDDFASGPFKNSAFTRLAFGGGYRDLWATPFEVPVLDLGTEAGGLSPVKRGGGLQTTSLRLQGEDGNQYGLRLLEKSGLAQVPVELRDGVVADVVRDQRAAASPFGALVAAPLADAAGILYQEPRIVYVPDDPRLGRYRETFAGRLALFEVRADDDVSDVPGLLGAYDVISAQKLREEMAEDQDHRVDQRTYLRARLLDALLGDWDRHQDQWRWSAYEPGELDPSLTGDAATKGKVYLPIPRDRDFAFFRPGGIMGFFLSYSDDRFEPYGEDFTDTYGLSFNGFKQDRRFYNELTREDFEAVARELQGLLPDPVIDDAIGQLPPPIRAQEGTFWGSSLKSRRDDLVEYANRLYRLHAPVVDVVGSNERELFEVTFGSDRMVEVVVSSYKKSEKGGELYRRTLSQEDTDEIRLYGFSGRDRFVINGEGSTRIRVIGGGGEDEVESDFGGVFVYDTPLGMEIDGRAHDRRSDDPDVNRYDPGEYTPTDFSKVPFVSANATDGLILGAGVMYTVSGFRLQPAATHLLYANFATSTLGVQGGYSGRMREAFGNFDLDVDAVASTPRYVRNFYGFGNDTPLLEDVDLARVNLAQIRGEALLGGELGQGLRLRLGPSVRYADAQIGDTPTVASMQLSPEAFEPQVHAGGAGSLTLDLASGGINPKRGVKLSVRGASYLGLTGAASEYSRLGGEAITYVPFLAGSTLALRAGADHRFGDAPFFDSAILGGATTLRGYRRERFTGETIAYGNAEVRAKLFDLSTYLAPVKVGVLGFADAGRAWDIGASGGVFDDLHTGFGGGLWFGVLDYAIINLTVARGDDDETLVTFGGGFQY